MTQVHNRTKIIPRLELLTVTICEFLKAFGADEAIDTVKKGVYHRHIIECISIYYFTSSETRPCFKVTLSINWNKHEVLIENDSGKNFSLKDDRPILEQLDKASKIIISHVEKLRKEKNVNRIEIRYRYIPKYRESNLMLQQAREYLGTQKADALPEVLDNEYDTEVRLIMDKLSELELTVYS